MRCLNFAVFVATLIGSLAMAALGEAAPLCPAEQGNVLQVVRLIHVSLIDVPDRVVVKDVWLKHSHTAGADTLCVSIDGAHGQPQFVKVVHTGTNIAIVKSNGDIDFKAAHFTLPVKMSFNISDRLYDPPYRRHFDQKWDKDVCVVNQNGNPNKNCTLGDFDEFTDQKVNARGDILSFTDPNKPNQTYKYGLYLYIPNGVIVMDPKIVNQ